MAKSGRFEAGARNPRIRSSSSIAHNRANGAARAATGDPPPMNMRSGRPAYEPPHARAARWRTSPLFPARGAIPSRKDTEGTNHT